jgi:hypothetical protein
VQLVSTVARLELAADEDGVLSIGARSLINFGCSIVAFDRASIGERCVIGPHRMIEDTAFHENDPDPPCPSNSKALIDPMKGSFDHKAIWQDLKVLECETSEWSTLLRRYAAHWMKSQRVLESEVVTPTMLARLPFKRTSLRAMAWLRLGSAAKGSEVPSMPSWTPSRMLRLYGLEIRVDAHS